jgi:hypothetical protein
MLLPKTPTRLIKVTRMLGVDAIFKPNKRMPKSSNFLKTLTFKMQSIKFHLITINIYIINIFAIISMDLFFNKSMYNGCWKVEVYIEKMRICAS